MIEIQSLGAVRVLTFWSRRANALDVELLVELTASIREQQPDASALVVTGAGPVFSAGVDLAQVLDGGADYTDQLVPALSEAFDSLFCYPGPTVAAINGAAIAGGCVLACACDRRLITPPGRRSGHLRSASECRFPWPHWKSCVTRAEIAPSSSC